MESSFFLPVTPINYETWERLTCIHQASGTLVFLHQPFLPLITFFPLFFRICFVEFTFLFTFSLWPWNHQPQSQCFPPSPLLPPLPLLSRYLKCVHVGPTDTLMTPLKGKCYYSGLRPRNGRKLHRWPDHGGRDVNPSWSKTNLILFPTGHPSWLISSNGLKMNKVQMSTNWGFQY